MASNATTAADNTAGNDIDWGNVTMPNNCERCGGQYDAIDAAHESLCSVCQDLFGGEASANPVAAFDTTPKAVDPRLKEGQLSYGACGRPFRPTNRNNGADCTHCCNKAAGEGRDIFSKYGKKMTGYAKDLLDEYHQRLLVTAEAPTATPPPSSRCQVLPSQTAQQDHTATTETPQLSPPAAVPTSSTQPTTTAKPPKRAAQESDDNEVTQQNAPTTKRSKTSQSEETTAESEQARIDAEVRSIFAE